MNFGYLFRYVDEHETMKGIETMAEYRNINQTQDAMKVVASWLARDPKLKIVYHGGTTVSAQPEKGIINIPRLAHSDGLDEETLMLLRDRIYHESGHVKHTELPRSEWPSGALFHIWNAVEDCRMEKKVTKEHPGTESVFQQKMQHVNQKLAEQNANGNMDAPLTEALKAMMMQSQGCLPAWTVSEKAQKYFEAGYDKFNEWHKCKNSKQALKLARELHEKLKEIADEEQDEDGEQGDDGQQGEDSGSNEGENEEGDAEETPENAEQEPENDEQADGQAENEPEDETDDSKIEDESEDEESDTGEDEDGGESDADYNGEDAQDSSENDEGSEQENTGKSHKENSEDNSSEDMDDSPESGQDDNPQEANLDDEIDPSLDPDQIEDSDITQAFENLDPEDMEYLSITDNDEHTVVETNDESIDRYHKDREQVSAAIASIMRALDQAMRARARCRTERYKLHGDIDMTRMADIAKSTRRDVFKRNRPGEKISTAVEIVIDESGSMSDECMYYKVRLAAIAISEALAQLRIPFEVTGTTTKYGHGDNRMPDLPQGVVRTNPIVYRHYKDFAENWQTVAHRISNSGHHHHNLDGEAVEHAGRRLLSRPESRKIVLSLSDGEPESGQGNHMALGKNIVRVSERLRENGVEVYGFGLGTRSPAQFYGDENFVHVPNTSELGTTLSSEFAKILYESRYGAN